VSRVCVVFLASRLRDGRFGVRMAAGTMNCFFSKSR